MSIGGVSIILILGILNLTLLFFQLATGLRWVSVPMRVHRTSGKLLVVSGTVHGLLAILSDVL